MKCVWYSLSPSFKLSNCRHFHLAKLFKTTPSPSNEIFLPDRFLTIMGEREGRNEIVCGVMKSVVTLLIKVVHISTNSSQSPPIWEEIMTWLTQPRSQYNIRICLRISESELLFSLQHVLNQRTTTYFNVFTIIYEWMMRKGF